MKTYGLSEMYGAPFPAASVIDHLMALRGLLIHYSKRPDLSLDGRSKLGNAITEVTNVLRDDLKVAISSHQGAPRELFEHYLKHVAYIWRWLSDLRVTK